MTAHNRRYRYYVSLNFDSGLSFAAVEIERSAPIASNDDISSIQQTLRDSGFEDARVVAFSLFTDPTTAQEG